ncbi:MAG: DUF1003 domain-containing protein [archaeon]
MAQRKKIICEICRTKHRKIRMIPLSRLNKSFLDTLSESHPEIKDGYICLSDFNKLSFETMKDSLEEEKGDLSDIEEEVVDSLEDNEVISENINELYQKQLSFGEKFADRIAEFGGSWTFIFIFFIIMLMWITYNTINFFHPFDKYPFILLNLCLSTVAAIQAPVILMSQNRQAERDRFAAEEDYKINLKAELQIQQIGHKLSNLVDNQITPILENQDIMLREIEELREKLK